MRSPSVIFPKYTHDTVGKTRALSRRKNSKIENVLHDIDQSNTLLILSSSKTRVLTSLELLLTMIIIIIVIFIMSIIINIITIIRTISVNSILFANGRYCLHQFY